MSVWTGAGETVDVRVAVAVTVTVAVMIGVKVAVAVGVAVGGRGVAVDVGVGGRITSVGVNVGAAATKGRPNGRGTRVKTTYTTTAARAMPPTLPMSFHGILLRARSSPQWGHTARPALISLLHRRHATFSLRSRAPQREQTTSLDEMGAPHHRQLSIPLGPSWNQHEYPDDDEQCA